VKQHVRHILNKLNLSSRVKAAVLFTKETGNAPRRFVEKAEHFIHAAATRHHLINYKR